MNSPLPQSQPPDSVWYGWILKLFHHWKVGERQVTYVWAVLVGMVGSCMSLFFEWMVEVIQWMLTGIWSDSRVGTFSLVEPEWRMFIPVAGGLVAGCILLFLKKRMPGQATEYMEAMSHRERADQVPGLRPESFFRGMEHRFRRGHRQGRAYHPVFRPDCVYRGAASARIHSAAPSAGWLRSGSRVHDGVPCPFFRLPVRE